MKYRPITDLTDDEVKEAYFNFCGFKDDEILELKRVDAPIEQVNIRVALSGEKAASIWTCIRDPFACQTYCSYDKETRRRYYQWCIAKGVCCWLKDNPYLEAENAD